MAIENKQLAGERRPTSYLEHVSNARSQLLRDWLVEDEHGMLDADFGDGVKSYSLREDPSFAANGKNRLLFDSIVSIQDLLAEPNSADSENVRDLITFHILASVCLEGELNKELGRATENERSERYARGGRMQQKFSPETIELARPILEGHLTSGFSRAVALDRTAADLETCHGIKISRQTLYRRLRP